jgi:hypothetical protein
VGAHTDIEPAVHFGQWLTLNNLHECDQLSGMSASVLPGGVQIPLGYTQAI